MLKFIKSWLNGDLLKVALSFLSLSSRMTFAYLRDGFAHRDGCPESRLDRAGSLSRD